MGERLLVTEQLGRMADRFLMACGHCGEDVAIHEWIDLVMDDDPNPCDPAMVVHCDRCECEVKGACVMGNSHLGSQVVCIECGQDCDCVVCSNPR